MKSFLKELVRPFVPEKLMTWYRLRQYPEHSGRNFDVFVEDEQSARRWLADTPDTYRVRLSLPRGEPPLDLVETLDSSLPVDAHLIRRAHQVLADETLAAVVIGETVSPQLSRRRADPTIGPRAILSRRPVFEEVGGAPDGDHPLVGLMARLISAGHHIGLIPVPATDAPTEELVYPIQSHPVVILAVVPMHDVGGGARSTQLALEFLRQGCHVTLASMYDAQESVDLGLRFIHPNLEQVKVRQFDVDALQRRVNGPGLVIVEAPVSAMVTRALALKERGWEVVYDLIDDWSDVALGGDWYKEATERIIVSRADRVLASAPDLVERLAAMGVSATLVPNAVNAEIFGVDLPPRPNDLPHAESIIGYHGSLYGNWFDWNALEEVARKFPRSAIVVIGDDKHPRAKMPGNVHFLGLKPQTELPAYIQRFDVAIIPFKLNDTTHAVSPLKVYEYLASGVPVASPPLRSLKGLDDVYVDTILVSAVEAAFSAPRPDRYKVLGTHSWGQRVADIYPSLSPSPSRGAVVVSRPVRHWSKGERLVP